MLSVNCVSIELFVCCSLVGMQPACTQGCNSFQPSERRSRTADVSDASDAQTRTWSRDRVPQDTRELYIETLPLLQTFIL